MRAPSTTAERIQPMRVIGIIASGAIAVLLVVGFVIGSLGIGSEGHAGQGLLRQPTPIVRPN